MNILILTDDRIGPAMAGSAMRAWEIARALTRAGHLVCLCGAAGSARPGSTGPDVVRRPPWRWAEVVMTPPWSMQLRALIGHHLLVVDGATPLLAELRAMPAEGYIERRYRTASARLVMAAARADAVLVASAAQEQWWRARMPARSKVPIVPLPFGISDDDPSQQRCEVQGLPRSWAVVLWWGGVWPWLDIDTLLAARARLGDAPVSIAVPTAARPGAAAERFTGKDLEAAMEYHGLEAPQVIGLDTWVPYAERHRLLNRTTLLAVLHHPGEEAELSFRTRALDGVWAGVPLLLTEGGEAARLARKHGWGAVIPPHDVNATAAALELMLSEREQLRCRARLAACRNEWRWSNLVEPLTRVLPSLPRCPHASLPGATVAAVTALLTADRSGP